jgi:acid stress-induced BolA-like protein IbaG/YrbA
MGSLRQEIIALIKDPKSGIHEPSFDLGGANGDVGGFVISDSFEGMPMRARQNMVWDYLEAHIPKRRLRNVITLLTLTPWEFSKGGTRKGFIFADTPLETDPSNAPADACGRVANRPRIGSPRERRKTVRRPSKRN